MVAMFGMVAFAVDLGYVAMVKSQLQRAADAGALAGTSKLLDVDVLKGTSSQSTERYLAKYSSATYIALNKTSGLSSITVLDGDIKMGYQAIGSTSLETESSTYNAYEVAIRRDGRANGKLNTFFAGVLGIKDIAVSAKARAVQDYGIPTGFKIPGGSSMTALLLPYTMKVDDWVDLIDNGGSTMDDYKWTGTAGSSGTISSASDGIKEVKLFPLANGSASIEPQRRSPFAPDSLYAFLSPATAATAFWAPGGGSSGGSGGGVTPGNFGTVDIGSSNNSTADLARQILKGPNASDFSYFSGNTINISGTSVTLNGDTGVSAGVKDELASIKGQPRIIPLYSSVSGSGNNANFVITRWVGVTIVDVQLTGALSSKHIRVQPCIAVDRTVILRAPQSGETPNKTIYRPLALTTSSSN